MAMAQARIESAGGVFAFQSPARYKGDGRTPGRERSMSTMADSPSIDSPSAKIAAAAAMLGDSSLPEADRIAAARALGELGKCDADARGPCVAALTDLLEGYEDNSRPLNSALIDALVRLKAKESVVLVGRALHDHCADETVTGPWEQVRYDLGVGPPPSVLLGAAPRKQVVRQAPSAEALPASEPASRPERSISPAQREAKRDKRRQAAKSRKRNRRRGR
jgi:hypothetical protein